MAICKLKKVSGADPSPMYLQRNHPCQHPDLRLLASSNVRQYISVVLATQFVVLYYGSYSKLMYLCRTTYYKLTAGRIQKNVRST